MVKLEEGSFGRESWYRGIEIDQGNQTVPRNKGNKGFQETVPGNET